MSIDKSYCGFIAIVGRPNVGKSTLLNKLLGQKISITSRKAQTTRHRIVGIHTEGAYQAIYVDTPGLHMEEKRAINRLMNKAASSSIGDVELVIFVVEGTRWTPDDEMVLNKLRDGKAPVILAVNKVDNVQEKADLLPHLQFLASPGSTVTPDCVRSVVSAMRGRPMREVGSSDSTVSMSAMPSFSIFADPAQSKGSSRST